MSRVASALVVLSVLALCVFGQLHMLQDGTGRLVYLMERQHRMMLAGAKDAMPAGPNGLKQPPERIPWPAAFRPRPATGRENQPVHQR